MSICFPATLVAVTIALATIPIALFVTRHHCYRRHHPLCCRWHHHGLPATLVAITIALFVAVAVHSPQSLSPMHCLVALALFVTRHPHRHCHHPCRPRPFLLCHPPASLPLPLLSPLPLPPTLDAVAITLATTCWRTYEKHERKGGAKQEPVLCLVGR